jgi:hypothetical protein
MRRDTLNFSMYLRSFVVDFPDTREDVSLLRNAFDAGG